MAKSANNFYTLRDIVERVSGVSDSPLRKGDPAQREGDLVPENPESKIPPTPFIKGEPKQEQLIYRGFRLMALQNQYRENFNFTFERLGAAINTIR